MLMANGFQINVFILAGFLETLFLFAPINTIFTVALYYLKISTTILCNRWGVILESFSVYLIPNIFELYKKSLSFNETFVKYKDGTIELRWYLTDVSFYVVTYIVILVFFIICCFLDKYKCKNHVC